jgi:spermidine synthase
LEDAVVKACRFFHDYNGYPLYDKRVDLVVNDARNHLLVTDKKYDVIISEPSNPWIAGAASLFTSEFFNLASRKLQPNGIFCQWIQLYELQSEEFQAILRSFTAAFPSVHIFRVDMDAILVGSTRANPIQLDQFQARLIRTSKPTSSASNAEVPQTCWPTTGSAARTPDSSNPDRATPTTTC